jgi:glycosyltransferase involved in cell wall biosynthesis
MSASITAVRLPTAAAVPEPQYGPVPTFPPHSIVHAAENIKGGVGAYLRDLLVMQRESFGAGVVTAIVPESQREMVQTPAGVAIVSFDDRGNRLLSTLNLARRMREIVARTNPAVVHLHSTFAGAALRPLLRLIESRAAVIYCAHGWAFDRDTARVSRSAAKWLERNLARWCDVVVCISGHEVRAAAEIGIPAEKLVQVSNGIPREAPRTTLRLVGAQWPEGKRRVLFVGRFDRQKGTDLLVAALAELQDSAFCYLVGDTVLGDADQEALPANARATGWLSAAELQAYYHSADVLVAPSRWEGFGLTAAEAMRAGLPVIASRVGGLSEIVEDGVTGVLIPPDDKRALVNALRETSDDRLAAMGRAGRQRFLRHFTLDRVHRQLTELYRRGLSQAVVGK